MTKHRLPIIIKEKYQFLQDISKIEEKQMKQELERRSTLEKRNWIDRSSRSTTTTPLVSSYNYVSYFSYTPLEVNLRTNHSFTFTLCLYSRHRYTQALI